MLAGKFIFVNVHIKIRKGNILYEFETLLKYNKGGQEAKETSGGGNKRVVIQNTKRIPSINFSFCEENTKEN